MVTAASGGEVRPVTGLFARIWAAPVWQLTVLVGVVAAVMGTVAALVGHQFFYVGDNPESFVPLWHHLGLELRQGHWNTMEASGWMGGNYVGEAAYSQWNPLLLLAYVVVSFFADLQIAAAVIMIAMLVLLAIGAFHLSLSYGVGAGPAFVVATAVPVTGFTLFYEAAGWPAGLSAFVGVTYFWLAVRHQTQGRWSPLITFIAGALAVTTGNPYALLGIFVVLVGVFIELLVARRVRDVVHLVIAGALVGAVALLVFLPLLGVQPVTVRQQLAGLHNDTFMVPDLGDFAGSSTVSYLPSITNWGGALVETLPSTYLAWFALPLLPWVRWRALWTQLRSRLGLLVIAGVFGLMTLGPSNLWLFRWPVRLIEYFFLAILTILALAFTQGFSRTHIRARVIGTAAILALGLYLAFAVTPGFRVHGAALILTLFLFLVLGWAIRRNGLAAGFAVMVAGTVLVAAFQTTVYPRGSSPFNEPHDVSAIAAQASSYEGTVLQLAQQPKTGPAAVNSNKILFGNLFAVLPDEAVNRYSGISDRALADSLCLDYKGQTCDDVWKRLWRDVPGTKGSVADSMNISTLVIQRASYPQVIRKGPPDGWHQASSDAIRVVWVRDLPLTGNGRVSGESAGVDAQAERTTETSEKVDVTASEAGWVTFARLAWPGYTASVNGHAVAYRTTPEGLLQVPVPKGSSRLQLSYVAPGLVAGAVAAGIAFLLAILQSILWIRRRPRAPDRALPQRRLGQHETEETVTT